jgi:hypothetical protein
MLILLHNTLRCTRSCMCACARLICPCLSSGCVCVCARARACVCVRVYAQAFSLHVRRPHTHTQLASMCAASCDKGAGGVLQLEAKHDRAKADGGGLWYFNGPATIKAKVVAARRQGVRAPVTPLPQTYARMPCEPIHATAGLSYATVNRPFWPHTYASFDTYAYLTNAPAPLSGRIHMPLLTLTHT